MKRWYAIGGGLLLTALVLFGVVFYMKANPKETAETVVQAAVVEQAAAPQTPPPKDLEAVESEAVLPYESPVDFEALWSMNPDIYAWLYIPGTQVNYPILQREGDDGFYLKHNSEGKSSEAGAVFTEATFTQKDFSDPVTVVYGHYMRSGTMFGSLQATYSAQGGMAENREIVVYLPERELRYQVFAAVPHDKWHLLHNHDYSDPEIFKAFLEQVFSVRSINASIDEEAGVDVGDQLLVLSTCLRGDSNQRYLVLAKKTAEFPAP